jgi:hypothetical protein
MAKGKEEEGNNSFGDTALIGVATSLLEERKMLGELTHTDYLAIIQPILKLGYNRDLAHLTIEEKLIIEKGLAFIYDIGALFDVGTTVTAFAPTEYLLPTMELSEQTIVRIKTGKKRKLKVSRDEDMVADAEIEKDQNSITLDVRAGRLGIEEKYTRRRNIPLADKPAALYEEEIWQDQPTLKVFSLEKRDSSADELGQYLLPDAIIIGSYLLTGISKIRNMDHIHINSDHPRFSDINGRPYYSSSADQVSEENLTVGNIGSAIATLWRGLTFDDKPYAN